MDQKQTNYVTMANGVLVHFKKYKTAWEGIEVVVEAHDEIEGRLSGIEALNQKQLNTTNGHTQLKSGLFDTMVEDTYLLALKVAALARKKKDTILLNQVKYSRSALTEGPEAGVMARCKKIVEMAQEKLQDLAKYEITQEMLDQLKEVIKLYSAAPAERDSVRGDRKTATGNLKDELKVLKQDFELLDDLVESMVKDKDFVSTYTSLRYVNDKGVRTLIQPEVEKV